MFRKYNDQSKAKQSKAKQMFYALFLAVKYNLQIKIKKTKQAFTLVELAIVLVIIGLLTGGVLVGKDLIKAAEVRSVIKDIDTYKTAVYTFINKYNCLPGDCPNATDYFGAQDPVPATCQTTASTGSLTCDGNGDGMVDNGTYEMYRFWQHLAIAGLIKGQYTGVAGSGGVAHHILGTNAPSAAISGSGFSFRYFYSTSGGWYYAINYGNIFNFGISRTNSSPSNGIFTPSEALAFDQKIDDGKPATGKVIAVSMKYDNIPEVWGDPDSCTDSVDQYDYTGSYRTSSSAKVCSFYIKSGL